MTAAFGPADEARLVDELRAGGDLVLSLVAERDGSVAGHVALSRLAEPEGALALAPLAVLPAVQRTGIGSALVRASLDAGRASGARAVVVLGDPAYYTRFGFMVEAAAGLASPYAGPHLMALMLASSGAAASARPAPALSGPLVHPAAFARLG